MTGPTSRVSWGEAVDQGSYRRMTTVWWSRLGGGFPEVSPPFCDMILPRRSLSRSRDGIFTRSCGCERLRPRRQGHARQAGPRLEERLGRRKALPSSRCRRALEGARDQSRKWAIERRHKQANALKDGALLLSTRQPSKQRWSLVFPALLDNDRAVAGLIAWSTCAAMATLLYPHMQSCARNPSGQRVAGSQPRLPLG